MFFFHADSRLIQTKSNFSLLAVYFEQQRWEDCLKECEKAIEIGRENKADYKLIAK